MKIKIFGVGGTIDKIYFDAKSEYQVGTPNIQEVLGELQVGFEYSIESLMRKDSLEMTEQDRESILEAVKKEPVDKVIVTHGTDTMVDTAKVLSSVQGKTIVLTGALEPAGFKKSDAVFNIGCAIAAVQSKKPGTYICMNGIVFAYDNVKKNVEKNRFEKIT